MCCTRLSENTGRKKSPFWHHRTTLQGYIFGTKASTMGKNLLNSNSSSTCPDNIVNFGLLTAEIRWRVWGTAANFNGFRFLAALLHGIYQWASARVCGVEQRAPPTFGRATIPLGIGPHSSSFFFFFLLSFFSSPNLSGRRLDVYHTLAHGVALMRIQNAI